MSKTYGLIADVHANDVSLKIALDQLENLGVDQIICAGDVVGYGGCPNETISLLQKYKVQCILGNHDFYFLALLIKEKLSDQYILVPDFIDQSLTMKFREIAKIMFEFQKVIISKESIAWLSTLPISLFSEDNKIFSIHGAPPANSKNSKFIDLADYPYALNKYLFPWDQNALSLSCYFQPADTMIVGHSHMQFAHQSKAPALPPEKTAHPCLMKYELFPIRKTFEKSYPILINPGSTGQSRDEIDAPGFATIKFQGSKKRIVTWYRFKYDYSEFEGKMKSKDAPPEIFDREFWHIIN